MIKTNSIVFLVGILLSSGAMAASEINIAEQFWQSAIDTTVPPEKRAAVSAAYKSAAPNVSVVEMADICDAGFKESPNRFKEAVRFVDAVLGGYSKHLAKIEDCTKNHGQWVGDKCLGQDGYELVFANVCPDGKICVKDFSNVVTNMRYVHPQYIANYVAEHNLKLTCSDTYRDGGEKHYVQCSAGGLPYEFEFARLNATDEEIRVAMVPSVLDGDPLGLDVPPVDAIPILEDASVVPNGTQCPATGNALTSINDKTKVGDNCSSSLIASGTVFMRKNNTCSCRATMCTSGAAAVSGMCCSNGRAFDAKTGKCEVIPQQKKETVPPMLLRPDALPDDAISVLEEENKLVPFGTLCPATGNALSSINEKTMIGDKCSSSLIASGTVFMRKDNTCSCRATWCTSGFVAVEGLCCARGFEFDANTGKCEFAPQQKQETTPDKSDKSKSDEVPAGVISFLEDEKMVPNGTLCPATGNALPSINDKTTVGGNCSSNLIASGTVFMRKDNTCSCRAKICTSGLIALDGICCETGSAYNSKTRKCETISQQKQETTPDKSEKSQSGEVPAGVISFLEDEIMVPNGTACPATGNALPSINDKTTVGGNCSSNLIASGTVFMRKDNTCSCRAKVCTSGLIALDGICCETGFAYNVKTRKCEQAQQKQPATVQTPNNIPLLGGVMMAPNGTACPASGNALSSINNNTKVGDKCSSSLIASGTVFMRQDNTCDCRATMCTSGLIAIDGVCCETGFAYNSKTGKCEPLQQKQQAQKPMLENSPLRSNVQATEEILVLGNEKFVPFGTSCPATGNALSSINDKTTVGGKCSSNLIAAGTVFMRQDNTCSCRATMCTSGLIAIEGICCPRGLTFDSKTGRCEQASQKKEESVQKKQETPKQVKKTSTTNFFNVCGADRGQTGGTEMCVADLGNYSISSPTEAVSLAKDYIEIALSGKQVSCNSVPNNKCTANRHSCIQCYDAAKTYYEVMFASTSDTNPRNTKDSVVDIMCKTYNGFKTASSLAGTVGAIGACTGLDNTKCQNLNNSLRKYGLMSKMNSLNACELFPQGTIMLGF